MVIVGGMSDFLETIPDDPLWVTLGMSDKKIIYININ